MSTVEHMSAEHISAAMAAAVARALPLLATVHADGRAFAGIAWTADLVIGSEQALPEAAEYLVAHGTETVRATLVGRDPTTNVAALRVATPIAAPARTDAAPACLGALMLSLGHGPTARLAMLAEAGPAWDSMAGGRIAARLRLDHRAGRRTEGGPVVDAAGGLLGMATSGPRGEALVIPAATLAEAARGLAAGTAGRRGYLGLRMQPVPVPDALREAAGQRMGFLVAELIAGGPAEAAGCLPGDILLSLDGMTFRPRTLAAALAPSRVGQAAALRLIRAGAVVTLTVTIAAHPGRAAA